jgi:hypothetical protein
MKLFPKKFLGMEIFVGFYMKPRFSPLFGFVGFLEKAEFGFFFVFRLVFGLKIFCFRRVERVLLALGHIRFVTG